MFSGSLWLPLKAIPSACIPLYALPCRMSSTFCLYSGTFPFSNVAATGPLQGRWRAAGGPLQGRWRATRPPARFALPAPPGGVNPRYDKLARANQTQNYKRRYRGDKAGERKKIFPSRAIASLHLYRHRTFWLTFIKDQCISRPQKIFPRAHAGPLRSLRHLATLRVPAEQAPCHAGDYIMIGRESTCPDSREPPRSPNENQAYGSSIGK